MPNTVYRHHLFLYDHHTWVLLRGVRNGSYSKTVFLSTGLGFHKRRASGSGPKDSSATSAAWRKGVGSYRGKSPYIDTLGDFFCQLASYFHGYLYPYMTITELEIHLESTKASVCIRPGAER